MAPASDFYKKLALELSSQQIAVDLFCFSSQFIDLTTLCKIIHFVLRYILPASIHVLISIYNNTVCMYVLLLI